MKPETKPFYKTSEFWMIVLANVVSLVTTLKGAMKPEIYVMVSSFVNAMYGVARGLAKSGTNPNQ